MALLTMAGSAPQIVVPGDRPCTAIAVPLRSPPPLTGAITSSRSGTSSMSSSAAVPAPAMTRGSS